MFFWPIIDNITVQFVFIEICSQSKHSAFSNWVNFLDFGESLKLLRRINLQVQKLVTRGTTTVVAVNIGGRFDAQHDTL
jgi:hypothetical protein